MQARLLNARCWRSPGRSQKRQHSLRLCRPTGERTETAGQQEDNNPGKGEGVELQGPATKQNESQNFAKYALVPAGLLLAYFGFQDDRVASIEEVTTSIAFALGYLAIVFEEALQLNKSGVALSTAVLLWTIRAAGNSEDILARDLNNSLGNVAQIVFFLLGAMSLVETIELHQGFRVVTDKISTSNRKALLWALSGITFFMSAVLDNLTSTIVMVSLLRKLVTDDEERRFFGAVIVLAANAGGAWTPMGDVTTTMLWINERLSTGSIVKDLFVPSAVCLVAPLSLLSFTMKGGGLTMNESLNDSEEDTSGIEPGGQTVFSVAVSALIAVPVLKQVTGLPPWVGMLFGLGTLWIMTDTMHRGTEKSESLSVPRALSRIDTESILFFLGILLSIDALDSAGVLEATAEWLNRNISSTETVATIVGAASAVIDNVPLVAATMGMYDLGNHPQDSTLWELVAYCAGTGGSMLVIGSAAGVAYMGIERVSFGWYLRKVTPYAALGYCGGIAAYILAKGDILGKLALFH